MCARSWSASGHPHRSWRRRKSIRAPGYERWGRYEGGATMRLKLYRAPAMADAMAQVRAELGEDALILATRRVGDGVEVTAAQEPGDDLPPGPAGARPDGSGRARVPRGTRRIARGPS